MDLSGKHVLITGGSSGIGLAAAKLMARDGANVSIAARNLEGLGKALAEVRAAATHPSQICQAFSVDVTVHQQVEELVNTLAQADQIPDILINAAGSARPGYFQELPLEVFHRMMMLNFFGTVHTCKALVPHMIQRRSGVIVNVSSTAGFLGVFGYTAYGASKFAVTGFSEALRTELKPYGIQVATLFPPDTDTPGFKQENETKPLETRIISGTIKLASAEDVAKALIKGIEQKKAVILPGVENKLLYTLRGLLRPLMDWYFDRCAAKARKIKTER
jgi:3-dehydrosphinganine reductase